MDLWVGDAAVESLEPHDVVVLDKVICCYPDADALIARSTSAAQRIYAFALPESRGLWGLHLPGPMVGLRARGLVARVILQRFFHDRRDVEAKVMRAGFRPIHTGRQFVWFVGVYARN